MEREEDDKDAKKTIQFSMPPSSVPTQMDPRQVEMLRRRRATPATLFRMTADPPSPDEDIEPHQWVLGEKRVLKSNPVNTDTYQPPSFKAMQTLIQTHLSSLDISSLDKEELSSEEEEEQGEKKSQQAASDLRNEREALRDQSASPANLTESADYHEAQEAAKE